MGLITETVETHFTATNYKHYQNKGYIIPLKANGKMNWSIPVIVKVEDLPKNSKIKVETYCDCCGKHSFNAYSDYLKQIHDDKTYCFPCSCKILKSGENHFNYNPNLTDEERKRQRRYPEYIEFVKRVLARDNYTCQCCGKKSLPEMAVHHLYGYAGFPEYRIDDNQSLTLCAECHKSFHNWHIQEYGYENRGKNTREQYEKWYGKAVQDLKEYNGELPTTRKIYDYEEDKIYNGAYEYANIHNCDNSWVYACCNHKLIQQSYLQKNGLVSTFERRCLTVKGHHLFWLDEYENMTKKEIKEYLDSCISKSLTKVVCLNTLEVFNSIQEALKKYPNANSTNITNCCICGSTGKHKYCGKMEDGTPLKWLYYEDYITKTPDEIANILDSSLEKRKTFKPVICLTTGVKYQSMGEAALAYGVSVHRIRTRCNNQMTKTSKKIPTHWMYYSEFEQFTEEEQNNLLEKYKVS